MLCKLHPKSDFLSGIKVKILGTVNFFLVWSRGYTFQMSWQVLAQEPHLVPRCFQARCLTIIKIKHPSAALYGAWQPLRHLLCPTDGIFLRRPSIRSQPALRCLCMPASTWHRASSGSRLLVSLASGSIGARAGSRLVFLPTASPHPGCCRHRRRCKSLKFPQRCVQGSAGLDHRVTLCLPNLFRSIARQ